MESLLEMSICIFIQKYYISHIVDSDLNIVGIDQSCLSRKRKNYIYKNRKRTCK